MPIVIGRDHRGLELKRVVLGLIVGAGHSCEDFGCYSADPVDYPDIARGVAEAVAKGNFRFGILICDTGIGMSIAANKVKGIRAALCHSAFAAARARQHNDASIICLAGRDKGEPVSEILNAFLAAEFERGRHSLRLNKLAAMEGG